MSEHDEAKSADVNEQAEGAVATESAAPSEKLRQEVVIRDAGPCRKHVKVTVNREDIDARINDHFRKLILQDHAMVPGFRPGKAPRAVVERRYRKEVLDQVRGEVLMASLEQISEDYDLAPLAPPDIDPTKIEIPESGPMVYEFEVEVRPQFDLPNYKGVKLKRLVHTFSEEEIDREMRRQLEPFGKIVSKGEGATVDIGDFIVADMVARIGDRVVNDVKEVQIRVENRLMLRDGTAPNVGDPLKFAKAGDQRVVDIELSDTVAEEGLRGRTVKATFDIKEVKVLQLPELTPELLETFGVGSPEGLREKILVALNRRLKYQQEQYYRKQILEMINEAAKWDLPRDLLMRQARRAFNRRIMEMRNAGISEEEIRARQRALERDVLASTAMALKEHFVLQKIAEVEKIEVRDEDIDAEIERLAEANDTSPRRIRAQLEREDMLETLAIELIERKALDLILENAEYEDVPLVPTKEDAPASVAEVQTVEGELRDPTAMSEPAPAPAGDTGE
ncbi:MAG: trigger factor [Gemmataceae bacterium]|nr:trigger factor [Gemmataceae bacterium]